MAGQKHKGLWIPRYIMQIGELSPIEMLLYADVLALDRSAAHCYKSNAAFADSLHCCTKSITRGLARLKELGYIHMEYSTVDNITKRRIMVNRSKVQGQ